MNAQIKGYGAWERPVPAEACSELGADDGDHDTPFSFVRGLLVAVSTTLACAAFAALVFIAVTGAP